MLEFRRTNIAGPPQMEQQVERWQSLSPKAEKRAICWQFSHDTDNIMRSDNHVTMKQQRLPHVQQALWSVAGGIYRGEFGPYAKLRPEERKGMTGIKCGYREAFRLPFNNFMTRDLKNKLPYLTGEMLQIPR